MKAQLKGWIAIICCLFFLGVSETDALASVMAIGPGAFPSGSLLIDFTGLANGTEVNGLSVGGVGFTYTVGGIPTNGAVIIDGGPGTTNNISPPNIVSVGNNTGILAMTLPGPTTLFGYGYAILASGTVPNATTISLLSGSTPVGSLSYLGTPDPNFTGGFAGIQSTIPFDVVDVTFNSSAAPAFALDNVRVANTAVPEPTTLLLLVSGMGLFLLCQLRNRRFID
jgi:PEP-CTERM motif-containing protein